MPHGTIEEIAERYALSDADRAVLHNLIAPDEDYTVIESVMASVVDYRPVSVPDELQPSTSRERMIPRPLGDSSRYQVVGLLGAGGMGDVWRVRDPVLNRAMAMKILRPELLVKDDAVRRFVNEAQLTAQLHHPGIPAIHELGSLPDNRLYFTMPEIKGQTLGEVITDVHLALRRSMTTTPTGWTPGRLIDAFHKVCDAVSYAHSRGVVHRDLKPSNIMVGRHGAVQVVDWGLAKVLERRTGAAGTARFVPHRPGYIQVSGTPTYMSPEQALAGSEVDPRSDVYSLGAILYEILSGSPPYRGRDSKEILGKVLSGPPPSPSLQAKWRPLELVEVCQRAMARELAERYATAAEVSGQLVDWLDGVSQREQGLALVAQAAAAAGSGRELRVQAARLRSEAGAVLSELDPDSSEELKRVGWDREDQADNLEREAVLLELEQEQLLRASLTYVSDLAEAHAALSASYQIAHEKQEALRNHGGVARLERLLYTHASALPAEHPARAEYFAYLKGDGALSLVTEPMGAKVSLERYEVRHRRLVPVPMGSLGRTPLVQLSLPMGSYLLRLQIPGRKELCYPVTIGRGEHWDGAPPGEMDPQPVHLPLARAVGTDECAIPAGWFWSGGDRQALQGLQRQRVWLEGFAIRRFAVTSQEYLVFINDLIAQGRTDEARRMAPQSAGAGAAAMRTALPFGGAWGQGEESTDDQAPVTWIEWSCALGYTRWLSERTGLQWRLPSELEWEKAARGVDGRFFPWGDRFDPSWCGVRESEISSAPPVDSFPVDESPYGVRGMAGNVMEWTASPWRTQGPAIADGRPRSPQDQEASARGALRVVRGSTWWRSSELARCAARDASPAVARLGFLGFRPVRSLAGQDVVPASVKMSLL